MQRLRTPDAPVTAIGFYGSTQNRTAPNANGAGEVATITNPCMGTVRQTDGPGRLQRWDAPYIPFAGLANLLDRVAPLSPPVIDMTGRNGRYQLVLEVSLNELPPPADLEEAVLKRLNDGLRKLGLQLERRRGEVDTLIVDRVEKRPTEN